MRRRSLWRKRTATSPVCAGLPITSLPHLEFNFGSLQRPSQRDEAVGREGGTTSRPERAEKTQRVYVIAPNPYHPEDFPALAVGR
ncbi:hypothetical protein J4Q44_G00102630 [Coregonus suidteri]|uniref:Uncharacterized protein n=1 Tax=Coregonus suidteri TaxID=861788 RepID=A0AAN8M0Y1_9TELE